MYPQAPFPYEDLINENSRWDPDSPECKNLDTGIFGGPLLGNELWLLVMVFVLTTHSKYAKEEEGPDNILIRATVYNRGPDPATHHVIPQL